MKLAVALRLGRVSNLPTVWTNVLAACALSGASPSPVTTALLCAALSLAYVGGMYLNDAFDRDFDARFRPERPIPSGQVQASTVTTAGAAMLLASIVLVVNVAGASEHGAMSATIAAALLSATIVFYNLHHKQNPLSPLLMGLCRVLVYVTAAYCLVAAPPLRLWLGAGLLLCYLIVLTAIAKQEVVRSLGMTVPHLIAGISLLDGVLAASAGRLDYAVICVFGWFATLAGQRFVPGT